MAFKAKAKPAVDTPTLANKERSALTVTVACNYGPGIFMEVHRMEPFNEVVLGGGTRVSERAVKDGPSIRIFGPSVARGDQPNCVIVGAPNFGYALTPNVPKDHFERWMRENADSDMVRNGCIFANPDANDAKAQASDHKGVRSGIEPLTPDSDPRNPKTTRRENFTAPTVSTGEAA